MDSHKNFAISLVATAPSPATSGTSLVVTGGEGTRFPTVPFNATVCPANADPTPANAEIVRVTAISTDTFTITRAQESSSARSIIVGDRIFAGATAKSLTDIEVVDAAAGTGSLRTLGTSSTSAAAGNDSRLSDSRIPTSGYVAAAVKRALTGYQVNGGIYTATAGAALANRAFLQRFVPPIDVAITKVHYNVTVTSATPKVDVGIYVAAGTTLLNSAGLQTNALNSSGAQSITIPSTSLTAGTAYYIAYVQDATGGQVMQITYASNSYQFWGGAAGTIEALVKDITPPLGNITSPSANNGGIFLGVS